MNHLWHLVHIHLPGGYLYRCSVCGETWTGTDPTKRPEGPCKETP